MTATLAGEVHEITTCGSCLGTGTRRRIYERASSNQGGPYVAQLSVSLECRDCGGRGYSRRLLRKITPPTP